MNFRILALIMILFISCKEENKQVQSPKNSKKAEKKVDNEAKEQEVWAKMTFDEKAKAIKTGVPKGFVLTNDTEFINGVLLNDKVEADLSKYDSINKTKNCLPMIKEIKTLIEFQEGVKNLGDLNGDKRDDLVYVLFPLTECEEGQSYYFSDTKIPRIETESGCCHPESLFSMGDIDEDGGNEIGEYYSSCAGNFKTITVWTLKNNKWKEIETFSFYYNNGQYEALKDFHKLYKKIAKNKFKFLEIYDTFKDGKVDKEWKTITMK